MGNRLGLEWWYAGHFTFGFVYLGIVPVLIPAYVISVTDSAAAAGVVMAILGLGALMAPAIGSFADRFRAHRIVQVLGLVAMSVAGLVFLGAKEDLVLAVAAVLLGFGIATMLMINPTFIVAAGFDEEQESKRLARLGQTAIIGQLTGALLFAVLAASEVSFDDRFLIMAIVAGIGAVITALTNGAAARRINVDPGEVAETAGEEASGPGLWGILKTGFGLFVLANLINGLGQASLESQYPNFMKKVFDIAESSSSAALSVGAVVSLVALGAAAWLLGRFGPGGVFTGSLGLRVLVAGALALLAGTKVGAVIPLGLYILLAVGILFIDTVNPAMAVRLSPTTAGAAQGMVMGALAIGSFTGGLLGGWVAEAFGFDWLPVLTAVGAALAVALAIPAGRGLSRGDAEAPTPATEAG